MTLDEEVGPVSAAEGALLRSQLHACREELAACQQQRLGANEEARRYRTIFDSNMVGVVIVRGDGSVLEVNQAYADIIGCSREHILDGHWKWTEATPPAYKEADDRALIELDTIGVARPYDKGYWRIDGSVVPIKVTAAILDRTPPARYIACVVDLSAQVRAEELLEQQVAANARLQTQEALIRELSTPLIPIHDSILVMPLIGIIDSQRAQLILERLLTGVAEANAQVIILDITGVAVVDTHVAQVLIAAASALRLLGTHVILTGIRPDVAQTIVSLGIDFSGIVTRNALKNGIAEAMKFLRAG